MVDFNVGIILVHRDKEPPNKKSESEKHLIMGKPLLYHNLKLICEMAFIKKIAVVCDSEESDNLIKEEFSVEDKILVVKEKSPVNMSIKNGLKILLEQDSGEAMKVVLIHEAWNLMIPKEEWLCSLVDKAQCHGAAGAFAALISTVLKPGPSGSLLEVLNRSQYGSIEMPFAFSTDVLSKTLATCSNNDLQGKTCFLKLVHTYLSVPPKLVDATAEIQHLNNGKDVHAIVRLLKERTNKVLVVAEEPMVKLIELNKALIPRASYVFATCDPQTKLHCSKCKKFNNGVFFPKSENKLSLIKKAIAEGWLDDKSGVLVFIIRHDSSERREYDLSDMEIFKKATRDLKKSVVLIHQQGQWTDDKLIKLISYIIFADHPAFDGQSLFI